MVCVPGYQTPTVYEGILAGAIGPAGPTGTYGRQMHCVSLNDL